MSPRPVAATYKPYELAAVVAALQDNSYRSFSKTEAHGIVMALHQLGFRIVHFPTFRELDTIASRRAERPLVPKWPRRVVSAEHECAHAVCPDTSTCKVAAGCTARQPITWRAPNELD